MPPDSLDAGLLKELHTRTQSAQAGYIQRAGFKGVGEEVGLLDLPTGCRCLPG